MARTITHRGTPKPIPTFAEGLRPWDALADGGFAVRVVEEGKDALADGGFAVRVVEDWKVGMDMVADARAGVDVVADPKLLPAAVPVPLATAPPDTAAVCGLPVSLTALTSVGHCQLRVNKHDRPSGLGRTRAEVISDRDDHGWVNRWVSCRA